MVDDLTRPDDIHQLRSHYDTQVDEYNERYFSDQDDYDPGRVVDDLLLERIIALDADRVLDMGCGNGAMVHTLCQHGVDAVGFDLSKEMVAAGRSIFEEDGLDETRLKQANIDGGIPFDGSFDVITGVGIFPHLEDTEAHLGTVRASLTTDGTALIQFRNALFNLYTMNEYTYHYIRDTVLSDATIPDDLERAFDDRLRTVCRVEEEGVGQTPESDLEGRFHHPMVVRSTFEEAGFDVRDLHFYHYHPLPPEFRAVNENAYDELAEAFEDPHDWRGHILASAFVVEGS